MIISITRAILAMIPDEVDVFAGRQRREQVANYIKMRYDFFCMMRRAMKMFERLFEGKTRKVWNYVYS